MHGFLRKLYRTGRPASPPGPAPSATRRLPGMTPVVELSRALRRTGLVAVALVVGISLVAAGGANAQLSCPDYPDTVYHGEYPSADEFGWTDNVQGVAHDDGHWFFTTQDPEYLMKFPVGFDLRTYLSDEDVDAWGILERRMPQSLEDAGYDDFKDLDQANGFLFVPVAGDGIAAIAVFRTSDLSYVGAYELDGITHASFAAFNPHDGLLYVTAGTKISDESPLKKFDVDFNVLAAGNADWAFTPAGERKLTEGGGAIDPPLRNIQGGVFTPWGDLYVVNGLDDPPSADRGGIHLFNPAGQLIDESTNGSGTFNFAYDPSEAPEGEEPEGADWWNRETGPASPGIGGQLHVIMIDNDVSMDDLYLKHYDVDYSCIAAGDEDADALSNGDEIYLTATNPRDPDSDNDHLADGLELNALGTDPLDRDSDDDGVRDDDEDFDGDGLSNGDEVNVHATDPTRIDTDADGLSDGDEVNIHHSDPLDPDSDGDTLPDGEEVLEHGSSPIDADTDDDGLTDGDEVNVHHTDPVEADTDHDLLDDGLEVTHGTDPLVEDSDGDGLLDGQDVEFIQHAVAGLPASAFLAPGPGAQTAMLALLDAAEAKLHDGKTHAASETLTKLSTRLDGCGQDPSRDDWIQDCPSQIDVRGLVDLLIANLNG